MRSHRWVAQLAESLVSRTPSSAETSASTRLRMLFGSSLVKLALSRTSESPWAKMEDLVASAMSSSKSQLVPRKLWSFKVNFLMEEEFVWTSLKIIDAVVAEVASAVVVAVAALVVVAVAASVVAAVAALAVAAEAASVVDVVAIAVGAAAVVAEEASLTLLLWLQTKAPCSNIQVPRFHSELKRASERSGTDIFAGVIGMSIDGVLSARFSQALADFGAKCGLAWRDGEISLLESKDSGFDCLLVALFCDALYFRLALCV